MDTNIVITGVAAFLVGGGAVVTVSSLRVRHACRVLAQQTEEIRQMNAVLFEQGQQASRTALFLADRLSALSGHGKRVADLIESNNRFEAAARASRAEARDAHQSVAAYQEVIVNQGDQIAELRAEQLERIEEQSLLEVELAAAKTALEAESGQADTWARTAANLGWNHGAPLVGAMSVAA